MMPTSPRSPLSFRTAGFPQYGWKNGISDGAFPTRRLLKPAPGMRWPRIGLLPSFVHRVRIYEYPAQGQVGYAPMHRRRGWVILLPRGPRSGPGCAVPVRHHLIDPIRPLAGTSRLHRKAAHTRCLRCAGAPRRPASGSGLADHSFLACRSL